MATIIRTKHRAALFFLLCSSLILLFTACGNTDVTNTIARVDGGKINIVAVENFYGEVAQTVGGDRVEVHSIISGQDSDPHDFEPTPDVSIAVNDAHVVIYNGIGYDDWMSKLIKASSDKSKSIIRVGEDVLRKKAGDNEHIWYDPSTMPKLAVMIANTLAAIAPEHADEFHQRAKEFEASLTPLNELVQKLKQPSSTPVAVSEPVFDYMLQALNYTVINVKFAKTVGDEGDPAPADVARLQDDIKQKKIRYFVLNTQTHSPIVNNIVELAKANGISIIEVTETAPAGKTYVQWMTDQLVQIENIQNINPY